MKFVIQYKNQYIKIKVNKKYFHIGRSYRFTSIKDMKNIIQEAKNYIGQYISNICLDYPNVNVNKLEADEYSIFYIPINKIITKWLINNICYYLHINKNKNIHLRIYK